MSRQAECTKEAAKAAAQAAGFTIGEEYEGAGRVIVHSFLNGWIGADWDLDAVLQAIDTAEGVYWQDGIARHDLAVLVVRDGQRLQYNFDVPRPADVVLDGGP